MLSFYFYFDFKIIKVKIKEVEAEINLAGDLAKVIKCNCSICKRKGAIMSMVKNEDFKITKGEDKLKLYQRIIDNLFFSFFVFV